MKTVTRKTILLVITLVLVLSVSVGLTLAYFSDYEQAQGEKVLNLGAQTEIDEDVTDNSKAVVIRNTGDTVVLVRVGIYGPDGMKIDPLDESLWKKGTDGFYYYATALNPGDATKEKALVATVKDIPLDKAGPEFDIVVVHETVQLAYDKDGNAIVPEGWEIVGKEA